jgi:MarR family transcriptional regulator for hemolysin
LPDKKRTFEEYLASSESAPEREPHGRLLYIIHELSRLIVTIFDQSMARHRLTHGQWWAIMHIYENQGVSQTDLAQIMQMGRASAGKLLERMEAKGWIERRPDPRDSRLRRVYLAEGVMPVFQIFGNEGLALFRQLLGNLDPEVEKTMLEGLRLIRANAEATLRRDE